MRLIERYIFRQLLGPTLLAVAALSVVALLSQSLSALSVLADRGASPWVFAKITLLAMPQLIVMILPVAVLVAALGVLNRLHTEHEFVICYCGGMSPWRAASPALRLSVAVGLASLALTLWIQPLCYRALRDTVEEARSDLVSAMIRPGEFTHPAPGLTVYVQAVDDDGAIHNLFINRRAASGRDITVTAREGRLETRGGVPMLVLRHGVNQELSGAGVLNFLAFDAYVFDMRRLLTVGRAVHYKPSDRYLHELFFPDTSQDWERANANRLLAEGHARLAAPLYNIAFMVIALAAVIGGPFSRTGYGGRMAWAAAAALAARLAGFAVEAAAGAGPALNALQYALPVASAGAAAAFLLRGPLRRSSDLRSKAKTRALGFAA